jgi:hypothetical protein
MEQFTKLFGGFLALVYHCFDRIVIRGHLPLLTRPENIVHFFRDVHGVAPITKEVLRQRTTEYNQWVEAFASNRQIAIEWAEKGVRKEDYVRPRLRRMERQGRYGVYFILKSMEVGTTFRSTMPKFPTPDPNHRILSRQRSRYTHYYFYIRDPVLGPIALCVGSFLPFSITYYLNGHHFIEQQLRRAGVEFRKDDNAFLWVADPTTLQAAADTLSAKIIRTRLEYWSLVVGPKFSNKDRHAINLGRYYSLQQVEYCRNLIFRRQLPHPQALRALLRSGAAAAKRRSHRTGLRLAPAPPPARQIEQRAGEDRPRPSRTARLCQERSHAHVREVLHLPASGGAQQQSEGLRPKQRPR